MNELKECPFCGSKAELMLASDNGWVVACQGECEAQTCSWVAPKNAIAAWNRRPTPENKPLTLDELREMDGEPVWVEHFDSPCSIKQPGEWLILKSCNPTVEHPYVDFKDKSLCALYYGQGWLAYARKPEQEATT